jgi:ubiquinone/menaquinone biosynthesis C-methylase UbiE
MSKVLDTDVHDHFDRLGKEMPNVNAVLDSSGRATSVRGNTWYDYFSKHIVLEILNLKSTDKVLDFGTGVGRLANYFAPFVQQIDGIDVSNSLLNVARKNRHPNANFYQSAEFWPSAKLNSYDKAFTFWVFAHISDELLVDALKQIKTLLKENSQLIFFEQTTPHSNNPSSVHIQRSAENYIRLCEKAGFTYVSHKNILKNPSRTLGIWKNTTWLPKLVLPLFLQFEKWTIDRKPENVNYYTTSFIFST